ncbi:MAG TPA: hypothetical protein VFC42_05605 [Methylomirabilota bacterium]|nr:hypothetical protein [Methylomirabilota bacterium]
MSPGPRSSLPGRLVGAIAWRMAVSAAYTTGLGLLIPFVAVRLLPAELVLVPVGTSPVLLWAASGLVGAAFVLHLWGTRSLGGTLTGLGRLTFVPGVVGILVALLGRDWLLGRLAALPHFAELRPALELYLDRVVPQVLYLTVGFFVAGILLLLAGDRLRPGRRGRTG